MEIKQNILKNQTDCEIADDFGEFCFLTAKDFKTYNMNIDVSENTKYIILSASKKKPEEKCTKTPSKKLKPNNEKK